MGFTQQASNSIISFSKPNTDYLIREILRFIGHGSSHENIRIDKSIFNITFDERKSFLRGFADVTGYIRRSNYFFQTYKHRVYLEIPHNWELVIDICNLLKSIDVPVQAIDWAHPNIRDGNLTKYNEGNINFWKKEHQIKIWANEFEPVGFGILHKKSALTTFADELRLGFNKNGKDVLSVTHKFYWDVQSKPKRKPQHPAENDDFIPQSIRGKHFDSWREIARELGYGEN